MNFLIVAALKPVTQQHIKMPLSLLMLLPNTAKIHIDLGLPQILITEVNDICSDFDILPHNDHLVEMIVNEKLPFGGDPLITNADIRSLYENSISIQGRWLSNFVMGILNLLKSSLHPSNNLKVVVLSWEGFQRV